MATWRSCSRRPNKPKPHQHYIYSRKRWTLKAFFTKMLDDRKSARPCRSAELVRRSVRFRGKILSHTTATLDLSISVLPSTTAQACMNSKVPRCKLNDYEIGRIVVQVESAFMYDVNAGVVFSVMGRRSRVVAIWPDLDTAVGYLGG